MQNLVEPHLSNFFTIKKIAKGLIYNWDSTDLDAGIPTYGLGLPKQITQSQFLKDNLIPFFLLIKRFLISMKIIKEITIKSFEEIKNSTTYQVKISFWI